MFQIFGLWNVLAVIVFAAVLVVLVVHLVRHKNRTKDFDDELRILDSSEISDSGEIPDISDPPGEM